MFEKFGEFDSYEEINRAAAAQKAEGDEEALIALAEENGIDKEDAEDYMDGCMDELCTVTTAALGKIAIEKKELEIAGVLRDWVEELEGLCTESPGMAAAIRKKGKSLAGYMGMITETGWKARRSWVRQKRSRSLPEAMTCISVSRTGAGGKSWPENIIWVWRWSNDCLQRL